MTLRAPPRPSGPGVRDRRDRSALERLREQQALIEEARLRARRRRQAYAALALVGVAVVVVVGFIGVSGGHQAEAAHASAPIAQGAADASNGKIAIADELGRLQVVDPEGSGRHVILHCRSCGPMVPTWSPDGGRIAFAWEGRGVQPRGRDRFSLYRVDSDGGHLRRLTACGMCGVQFGGHLSWSPDGSWLAFSRQSGPRLWTHSLWLVNTAGKVRRLTKCQLCADVSPAWAPSGQLIVFSRIARKGSSLYTVRPDGSHLTKITNSAAAANPQWSPDGRQIAFDGNDKIFIVNADGSDQKLLVDGTLGRGPGAPSWSPDGTKLAFFSTPGDSDQVTAEVWTMAPDGSAKQRLYHSVCCIESWAPPIWSPDGQKIAFAATSTPPGFAHVPGRSPGGTFTIGSDGTGLLRLIKVSAQGITWQRLPVN